MEDMQVAMAQDRVVGLYAAMDLDAVDILIHRSQETVYAMQIVMYTIMYII